MSALVRVLIVVALFVGVDTPALERAEGKGLAGVLRLISQTKVAAAAETTSPKQPQVATPAQPTNAQPAPAAPAPAKVELTDAERRKSAVETCKLIAAMLGRDPNRCDQDPEQYFKELAAEQQKKREAEEQKRKAVEARSAKKAQDAQKAAEAKKAADAKRAEAEAKRKAEQAKAEADRQREAEAKAATAERARQAAEAKAEAAERARADAERARLDAEKAKKDAEAKVAKATPDQGKDVRTGLPPSSLDPSRRPPRRIDSAQFSILGLAGVGSFYGLAASGRWSPAFFSRWMSLKMDIGAVQVANSDLEVREIDSANRLYWSVGVPFNVLKSDGFTVDVGPSYTWIGKFSPHKNTARMFGAELGASYRRLELGLGVGNNPVDNGYLPEGMMFHGHIGYRIFGF